jgi:hypothetical protein
MKSKKEFKVTFNYIESPGAEDRLFEALNMLITEEDLLEYCAKKSHNKQKKA